MIESQPHLQTKTDRKTVLVVDDNIHIRTILKYHLEKEDYIVLEAGDGQKAVEAASANKLHAILLDIMMPVMDGYQACRAIKTIPLNKDVPIIMLTAKGQKEDILEALKSGADDYIVKPFRKEMVLKKLDDFISGRANRSEESPYDKYEVERRESSRTPIQITISLGPSTEDGLAVTYKSKILNMSLKGLAFEFEPCEICGGYEKDVLHTGCVFSKFGKNALGDKSLTMFLKLSDEVILTVTGKVVHIFRPEGIGKEIIGVELDPLLPANSAYIRRYLADGKV